MSQDRIITAYLLAILLVVPTLFMVSPLKGLEVNLDTSLADSHASFWGEDPGDWSGWAISGAGDVNGDGFDDILISAPSDEDGGLNAGQTYLILGKASGWAMDTNLSTAAASFWGEASLDCSGRAISEAGDVNGDEFDDFLIGASGNDDGGSGAGQTYLILGKASGWAMDTDLSTADASFWGEDDNDLSGYAVSGAGDVNGDGFDDFLIGAPWDEEGGGLSGQTYLILGKASGWAMDTNLSTVDASFWGEDEGDYSGNAVSGAGDVNGDGFDDFLIGASVNREGGNSAGQTYLFLGKASGWAMDTVLSAADASFWGEGSGDQSGYAVSGAGDVNGDGFDDFLIGARANSENGKWAGQTYLILGKASGWAMDTDLSAADASFWGEGSIDYSGNAISGAGDVNGDGFDDFLIGAYFNDEGGDDTGQTYLILGRHMGWTMDSRLSTANASFLGEAPGDCSGEALSGAGDVNGDGFDDIIIGALRNEEGGYRVGQTYLIFPDHNTPPTDVTSVTLYSDSECMDQVALAYMNTTVYVRAIGVGGNSLRADVTEVAIASSASPTRDIGVRLLETGANSNTFEGSFQLRTMIHEGHGWIATSVGETVTVRSAVSPSTEDSLVITARPVISRLPSNLVAEEDEDFEFTFILSKGVGTHWRLTTDIEWVEWNASNQTIRGAPTNLDVGTGLLTINVTNDYGDGDELDLALVVRNKPPRILTTDVTFTEEDSEYLADYASDDDGQGTVTWHLATDAGWLSIDPASGVLSGTPANEDVGKHRVNVSVDDGNGGWDSHNFTLTVTNVNDPPILLPPELPPATEDVPYNFALEALDPDPGDTLFWNMRIAARWLRLDGKTGELSGTPTNDDVGDANLEVTVTDRAGRNASLELAIRVLNVNDPPAILSGDVVTAIEDSEYRVEYRASDPDVGDTLAWSLDTDASWLHIDGATGVLSGLPANDDVGIYRVTVTVTDGSDASASHEFTLRVLNVNDPPEITSDLPSPVEAFEDDIFWLNLTCEDVDDDVLTWSDDSDLFDVSSTNGTIAFVPTQSEVGEWWANITVMDGEGLTDVVMMRFVVLNVNDAPVITDLLPMNGSRYKRGEMVPFGANTTDEDGDELTYTWYLGEKVLGEGRELGYSRLGAGTHTVRLVVGDGNATAEARVVVEVIQARESSSWGLLLGGVLVVVVVIVALMILRKRRSAVPPA